MKYLQAIIILGLFFMNSSAFSESKTPKVVVIGGGLAGLTTAHRLNQQGVDVKLFEAKNRVGGRVFSIKCCNTIAELGGQSIYDGGQAETLLSLIEEFNLELSKSQVKIDLKYFDGKNCTPENEFIKRISDSPDSLKEKLKRLSSTCNSMDDVIKELVEEDDPLRNILSVRIGGYEGDSIEKLSTCYTDTLYYVLLGGLSSVHQRYEDLSLIDVVSIKGGNSNLPFKLAEALGDKVCLGKVLVNVSKDETERFVLTFEDGHVESADYLALAIPSPIYKEISFDEKIVDSKRLESIKNIPIGTNTKIILPQKDNVKKAHGGCINDRMISFFNNSSGLLTMYYTGPLADMRDEKTLVETYSNDRKMVESCFEELHFSEKKPVFANDIPFSEYDGPVCCNWKDDCFIKGSYTYISPTVEKHFLTFSESFGEKVKTLYEPIDNRLFFAGEHTTTDNEILGTMEAAAESGTKAARMILRALD